MLTGVIESDGREIFVVYDGKRIAKRGHPGTRHAGMWIPLEPGFTVRSRADLSEIKGRAGRDGASIVAARHRGVIAGVPALLVPILSWAVIPEQPAGLGVVSAGIL